MIVIPCIVGPRYMVKTICSEIFLWDEETYKQLDLNNIYIAWCCLRVDVIVHWYLLKDKMFQCSLYEQFLLLIRSRPDCRQYMNVYNWLFTQKLCQVLRGLCRGMELVINWHGECNNMNYLCLNFYITGHIYNDYLVSLSVNLALISRLSPNLFIWH